MNRVGLVVGTCTAAALLVSGCAGDATPSSDASVPVDRQAQANPSESAGGLGAVITTDGTGGNGGVGGNGGAGAALLGNSGVLLPLAGGTVGEEDDRRRRELGNDGASGNPADGSAPLVWGTAGAGGNGGVGGNGATPPTVGNADSN